MNGKDIARRVVRSTLVSLAVAYLFAIFLIAFDYVAGGTDVFGHAETLAVLVFLLLAAALFMTPLPTGHWGWRLLRSASLGILGGFVALVFAGPPERADEPVSMAIVVAMTMTIGLFLWQRTAREPEHLLDQETNSDGSRPDSADLPATPTTPREEQRDR